MSGIIESNLVNLNKTAAVVFEFLSNLSNHQKLMPEAVHDWTATKDECSFTIQNIAKLELKIDQRIPNTKITIIPKSKAPFPLTICWDIIDKENSSAVKLTVHADMNPFVKMVVSPQLQKLVDYQVDKLNKILA